MTDWIADTKPEKSVGTERAWRVDGASWRYLAIFGWLAIRAAPGNPVGGGRGLLRGCRFASGWRLRRQRRPGDDDQCQGGGSESDAGGGRRGAGQLNRLAQLGGRAARCREW
jgi:hypothetical protein